MPKLSRTTANTLVALAILGAITLTLGVTSSPAVCSSCHAMRPYAEALATSPHSGTGCYSCHLDSGAWDLLRFKAIELTVMYPKALGGAVKPSGPGVHVATSRCAGCHAEVLEEVVERGGMRVFHETCAEPGGTCDACHSAATHGQASRWPREYEMERCVRCHADTGAPRDCDSCHREKLERERLQKSAWRVTHGAGWERAHGAGDLAYCVTCHPPGYCARCHGLDIPHPASFGQTHGDEYIRAKDSCTSCHSIDGFCDTCHGIRMPHTATFLREHPEAALSRDDAACLRCHHPDDCRVCHERHTHPGRTDGTLGKG